MIEQLVYLLVYLLILGIVLWLVLYVINTLPLPAPFNQVARIIVIVIACLILIILLLQLAGGIRPLKIGLLYIAETARGG